MVFTRKTGQKIEVEIMLIFNKYLYLQTNSNRILKWII